MPSRDDMFNTIVRLHDMANAKRIASPGTDLHDPAKAHFHQRIREDRTDADRLDIAASAVDFISSDTDLMRRFTAFRNGAGR